MAKDAKTSVSDYMTSRNRPFSVNDIVVGLRNEIGKNTVQKAVDSLVGEGKLVEKQFGKQKVYVLDQSKLSTLSDAEIRDLDAQVNELKVKLREIVENNRKMEKELKSLNNTLTTAEAKHKLEDAKKTLADKSERLDQIKENSGPIITKADREKIHKRFQTTVKEWKKRKNVFKEMSSAVLESYPKSKKHFFEEVGIEEDGDLKIPQI